jgi:hypothetical protein
MTKPQIEIKMTEDLIKELKYKDIDPDDVAEQLLGVDASRVTVDGIDVVRVGNTYDLATNETAAAGGESTFGWAALGFFVPLAGLILYATWQQQFPLRAKAAGKGALAGVITTVVFFVIYIIIVALIAASATSSLYRY